MGAATQLVTVQHERAKAPRIERISGRVKVAIDAMVYEALPRSKAAKRAGLSEHGLYKALRKPPVLAYMNSQMGMIRTSAASRTIAKAEKLMDEAESEHVQADMTKWLAGLEGIAPTQRIENTHIHRNAQPGLTINFISGSLPGDDALLIDSQRANQAKPLKAIGNRPSVPHPSVRNAVIEQAAEAIDPPPVRAGVGEK